MNLLRYPICLFIGFVLFFQSCVDDDFDHPPIDGVDPDIEANTTIAELKAMHTLGAFEEISEHIIIAGIVIADDRSGNFFKSITIQDSTGGIELRMNENDLFNEYGEGRKLYVKCNRLWLGDYNGVTQLGSGTGLDDRGRTELTQIPSALFDEYIVKGKWNIVVEPTVRTVSQLRSGDISTLVKIENIQFALETCTRTYAIDYISPEGNRVQESLNQNMELCTGSGNIVMRSSGFANFASDMLPVGSGSVTAVYTVFGDTKQLIIRDLDDIDMTEDRCGNSGISGDLQTIRSVRDMFNGSPVQLSADIKISGTVISDKDNGNTTNKNIVIQDESGGIVVRFDDAHDIGIGEIVEINLGDTELSEWNGLLQIMNTPNANAFSTCIIGEVAPRVATVQELLNNSREWESTLVKVEKANISGSATFSESNFVTDATNSMRLYTNTEYATFAGEFIPIGEVAVTAILSYDNGAQIYMRSRSDVEGGEIIEPDPIAISDVRSMYSGATTSVSGNVQITGVVISDAGSENIHGQNLVLQDASGGIVIRFTESHPYVLGDELTISIGGQELSEFNTLLQLNNIGLSNVTSIEEGDLPTPRVATVAEIQANGEAWESTLVTINNARITGSSTFNGNTTINDGSASIVMYTRPQASFAGSVLPSGDVSLTGYVSEFGGTRQIGIRNLDDVK